MHLTFYVMIYALKYEHVSAFQGVPDGSSEGTPRFEVEIKDILALDDAHGGVLVSTKEFKKQFHIC